ncbi:NUDIX hydrolase family protein [Advenella sp. S44]|uniref:NUDIX hydrolase n=1 Tax=Advenella sp. S44 TaxID=1982755 RepID=UPI001F5BB440|nr:DUF4743 domain-containing protein [Advenella sp. S44]
MNRIPALYAALLQSIQEVPPEYSLPLTIAGKLAGFITPQALAAIAHLPQVRTTATAVHLADPGTPRFELEPLLADIAIILRDAGLLKTWRNELLTVYAEGENLAKMERSAMRPLGLLTHAVHLNAWTPDLQLYIAKRAMTKATDPGMWDTLAGGLANGSEDREQALLRETLEEAGLPESDLTCRTPLRTLLRMHRRLPEGYQVEDILVSDCILAPHVAPRNMDGEVSEIRIVSQQQAVQLIAQRQITLEASLVILEGMLSRSSETLLAQFAAQHQNAGRTS